MCSLQTRHKKLRGGAYRVTMPVENDRGEGTMAQMKGRLAHFETEEGRRKVRESNYGFAPWHASASTLPDPTWSISVGSSDEGPAKRRLCGNDTEGRYYMDAADCLPVTQ